MTSNQVVRDAIGACKLTALMIDEIVHPNWFTNEQRFEHNAFLMTK